MFVFENVKSYGKSEKNLEKCIETVKICIETVENIRIFFTYMRIWSRRGAWLVPRDSWTEKHKKYIEKSAGGSPTEKQVGSRRGSSLRYEKNRPKFA